MRLGVAGIVVCIAGCGGFLGLSGDDKDDEASPSSTRPSDDAGPDASTSSGESDGASAKDGAAAEVVAGPCIGGTCARWVFVTKDTYTGNLGGVEGADAKCQAAGDAFMAGRQWKAWLSGPSSSVNKRHASSTSEYVSGNGPMVVAQGWAGFASATHLHRIMDEMNKPPANGDFAWTGTTPGGDGTGEDCAGFTTTFGVVGTIGNSSALDANWSAQDTLDCSLEAHLYCVEQ